MKKAFAIALVMIMAIASVPSAVWAASASSAPITTSAVVDATLTLNVVLKKNDFAGATVTTMDFGKLINIGTGTLRSSPTSTTGTGAVAAFISANTSGTAYTITQSGTAMSNGAATLPSGALTVVPTSSAADNGGVALPAGASVGTAGTWVGTRTLYNSGAGAAVRNVVCYYSVTDDAAAGATTGIPLSQPGGTYTGSVTITVTTV